MRKTLSILAIATLTLYGCGGGSSGSSDGDKGTKVTVDYPIKNAKFAPTLTEKWSYELSRNKATPNKFDIAYKVLTSEQLLEVLEQSEDEDAKLFIPIVNDLVNFGVKKFYFSDENNGGEISHSLYFAGTDGALHEIDDAYVAGRNAFKMVDLMKTSPLFRLSGDDVKENDPNISIGGDTISESLTLSGGLIKVMLEDFEGYEWLDNLPDTAVCNTHWQQSINETGVRKTLSVSGKKVETAYLEEKNTYNLRCDEMDSMEFSSKSSRWFNPRLGIVEQSETFDANQVTIEAQELTLSAFK